MERHWTQARSRQSTTGKKASHVFSTTIVKMKRRHRTNGAMMKTKRASLTKRNHFTFVIVQYGRKLIDPPITRPASSLSTRVARLRARSKSPASRTTIEPRLSENQPRCIS